MHIIWAVVVVTHLGANAQFIEAWATKEPCRKQAAEILNAICVPVVVNTKQNIEKQVQSLNELLK
jgi:hypothetical protein